MTILERPTPSNDASTTQAEPPAVTTDSSFDDIIRGMDKVPVVERRRQTHGLRILDLLSMIGAIIASLAFTTLLTTQWAPIDGPLPFFLIAYVAFVVFYTVLVSLDERSPAVRDRIVAVAIHSLAATVVIALIFVVGFTAIRGVEALPYISFFTEDMSLAGPLDPLSEGGVLHAIAGSLIQISIALAVTIPLGVLTALFLTEVPGKYARFVRTIVEAMTALPSIVAGLFIFATFILVFGLQKSGMAAALAISVMMLPIMIRAADVVFRLVPHTLREASIGLGAGQWRTVWHVVLPTSRSGLTTAIILATARGIGETSPVLLTSGFTAALNTDPLNGPMVSLPLAVFQFVKSPEPNMIARGFGTAVVLLMLVLILFVIARIIGGQTVAKRDARRRRVARLLAPIAPVARRTVRLVRVAAHRVLIAVGYRLAVVIDDVRSRRTARAATRTIPGSTRNSQKEPS